MDLYMWGQVIVAIVSLARSAPSAASFFFLPHPGKNPKAAAVVQWMNPSTTKYYFHQKRLQIGSILVL
jgi:hypothetical protein